MLYWRSVTHVFSVQTVIVIKRSNKTLFWHISVVPLWVNTITIRIQKNTDCLDFISPSNYIRYLTVRTFQFLIGKAVIWHYIKYYLQRFAGICSFAFKVRYASEGLGLSQETDTSVKKVQWMTSKTWHFNNLTEIIKTCVCTLLPAKHTFVTKQNHWNTESGILQFLSFVLHGCATERFSRFLYYL